MSHILYATVLFEEDQRRTRGFVGEPEPPEVQLPCVIAWALAALG
jgi:hypothetical protein